MFLDLGGTLAWQGADIDIEIDDIGNDVGLHLASGSGDERVGRQGRVGTGMEMSGKGRIGEFGQQLVDAILVE